jgi:hypothetical protein
MCISCGYPPAPGHWTDAGAADPGERIRARFRRVRVLNAVLRLYGLTAHDGGLIPGIQIATLSGSQTIVDDLAGVWVAAERLAGMPVDPLDQRFLGAGGEAP